MNLTVEEKALAGQAGPGAALAMRLVCSAPGSPARRRWFPLLQPISTGRSTMAIPAPFSPSIWRIWEQVAVRSTLNVGAVDLMHCSSNRLPPPEKDMARRMMKAYRRLGCEPSWTCAPYQAGHRPALSSDGYVAWN